MTPIIVLLALILAAVLLAPGALVALMSHKAPALFEPAPEPAELGLAELAEAIAARMPTPAPAGDLLDDLVAHKYVVTLNGDEGMFAGVLTDVRVIETAGEPLLVYYLEHCSTLPADDGDTPRDIAGRVIIDSSDIAYLQQIG